MRKKLLDYEFDVSACMIASGSVVPRVERLVIDC